MRFHKSLIALPALLALAGCNLSGSDQNGANQGDRQEAVIGDYAWLDENRNGIQDKGEAPFPDLEVSLHTADGGELLERTQTDNQGHYSFVAEPGEYRLQFELPGDYAFTQKDAQQNGRDTEDSDVFASGNDQGWTETFTVLAGVKGDLDAGYYSETMPPPATPTPLGRIVSPTGVPVTATATATPVSLSGEYVVQVVVVLDEAGHVTFVALADAEGHTTVVLDETDGLVEMGFTGTNPQNTSVTLSGPLDADGNLEATGGGTVAGFQQVSANFQGSITTDADGNVHLDGQLTLGPDGELPQGKSITYQISN